MILMVDEKIYIYGLVERDVAFKHIRYIGITNNLGNRLTSHLDSSESTPKAAWIDGVKLAGGTVDMVLLDAADNRKDALLREAAWIKFAEGLGWELTNVARPASSSLALVDTSSLSDDDYHTRMVSAIYEGRKEAVSLAYDIRNDILSIIDKFHGDNEFQNRTHALELPPLRQSAILAAVRQCWIGAGACVAVNMIDIIERRILLDLSLLTVVALTIMAIMFVYPLFLTMKMVYAWLMAYGDPIGFAFGRDGAYHVRS